MDQLTIVLSGPGGFRGQAAAALRKQGFVVGPETHGHGLPSYTDPITAHAAGKPNSGHTPGTKHPSTLTGLNGEDIDHDCDDAGSPYEDDPSIEWITVTGTDVDAAHRAVAGLGWQLRMHGYRSPEPPPDPILEIVRGWDDMKRRIAELEAQVS